MSFPQKVDTLTLKCVTHRFVHCSSSCIASLAVCNALRADAVLNEIIPPLSRWDFLIYPQQNLFVFSGTPEISDFWGEEE